MFITMSDHYTCEAVAVHCIDFRFQKAISEYLALKFPEGYDRISVAGGVKNILEQREESIVVKNTQKPCSSTNSDFTGFSDTNVLILVMPFREITFLRNW